MAKRVDWILLSNTLLGISLGGFLMTEVFRTIAGLPESAPSALQPVAFVIALNVVFGVGVVLAFVALFTSAMRGAKLRMDENEV